MTKRLALISLSVECLQAMAIGDHEKAQETVGFLIPRDCLLLRQPWIEHRIGMIARDSDQHPWMYRAIVRKSDNVMVGNISFHHKAPDPDLLEYSSYSAELGYTIDVGNREQGYAKESALAMMDWANLQNVDTFCLTISPQNMPSVRMAESMGFRKIAERIDEIDGLEGVYIADIATIRHQRDRKKPS